MNIKPVCCLLLACSLIVVGGCHKKKPPMEEKSATELNTEGQKNFSEGDYEEAITSFQKVKDWYPFSDLVIPAQLKIADANYFIEEYDLAAAAYDEFVDMHPRNESTPYAMYQAGLCFFEQKSALDRDTTYAQKALDRFSHFAAQYPDSTYAVPARSHIKECERIIAAHEFLVARYYFDRKYYNAALKRFNSLITERPDSGIQHLAMQYLTVCEEKIKKGEGKTAPDSLKLP